MFGVLCASGYRLAGDCQQGSVYFSKLKSTPDTTVHTLLVPDAAEIKLVVGKKNNTDRTKVLGFMTSMPLTFR